MPCKLHENTNTFHISANWITVLSAAHHSQNPGASVPPNPPLSGADSGKGTAEGWVQDTPLFVSLYLVICTVSTLINPTHICLAHHRLNGMVPWRLGPVLGPLRDAWCCVGYKSALFSYWERKWKQIKKRHLFVVIQTISGASVYCIVGIWSWEWRHITIGRIPLRKKKRCSLIPSHLHVYKYRLCDDVGMTSWVTHTQKQKWQSLQKQWNVQCSAAILKCRLWLTEDPLEFFPSWNSNFRWCLWRLCRLGHSQTLQLCWTAQYVPSGFPWRRFKTGSVIYNRVQL